MSEIHCYHHEHDYADGDSECSAGDCGDEDDCVHCECCCSCLGCEYGPRDSVLMTPEQMAPLGVTGDVTR